MVKQLMLFIFAMIVVCLRVCMMVKVLVDRKDRVTMSSHLQSQGMVFGRRSYLVLEEGESLSRTVFSEGRDWSPEAQMDLGKEYQVKEEGGGW